MTTLKIFFHDACFDGTAAAAVFSRFYRDVIAGDAQVVPVAMQHREGDPFSDVAVDGDDNACVDFRYCASPQMRWWFDHHRTAFQPSSMRQAFDDDRSGCKFFDPDAPSCTGFLAEVLAARWGWKLPRHLEELVSWADTIDAAAYDSAAAATSLEPAAQRLALWVSSIGDPVLTARYIAAIAERPLAEVATLPWIADRVAPLIASRPQRLIDLRGAGRVEGDVVSFDLTSDGSASPGFLGYLLFPECRYTVAVVRTGSSVKISVGSNPWGAASRGHDIGAMCERHGGGGHAAVGGITLGSHEVERGQAIARAIAAELRAPSPAAAPARRAPSQP